MRQFVVLEIVGSNPIRHPMRITMNTIIDLSVVVNEQTPVYPGDPAMSIKPAGQLAKDGFNDHLISIGTHVGTHIDGSPARVIAEVL